MALLRAIPDTIVVATYAGTAKKGEQRIMKTHVTSTTILMTFLIGKATLASDQCAQFDLTKQEAVSRYLQKRYNLPDQKAPTVRDSELVAGTCFRKIILQSSPHMTFVMYLSPDARYLTPVLMDLASDPSAEAKAVLDKTEKLLLSEKSPFRGAENAPVTLVEFSDFQCPFCRRFAGFFNDLPAVEKAKVRLVYKEFPLSMHSWAKLVFCPRINWTNVCEVSE